MLETLKKLPLFLLAAALLAVALLLALTLNGGPGAGAATTFVVDGDGAGTPTDCDDSNTTNTYSTIAAAEAAASDGDTILICPGTYSENVTYDVANLTVQSHPDAVNPDDVILKGSGAGGIPVTVEAAGFTLDPLTIEDDGNGANQAIWLKEAADGYLIKDVTILTDGFDEQVVFVDGADDGTIDGLNIVEDTSGTALDVPIGILISADVDGATITNTDIDGIDGDAGDTAIEILGKDVTLDNVTIHDTADGPDIGIRINDPDAECDAVDPCDYTLTNVDITDWLSKGLEAVFTDTDTSLDYDGGTIQGRAGAITSGDIGIDIEGGQTVSISNVTITGASAGSGIGIEIDDDATDECDGTPSCTYTLSDLVVEKFLAAGIEATDLLEDVTITISNATVEPDPDATAPSWGIRIWGGEGHVINNLTTVTSGASDGYVTRAIIVGTDAPGPNNILLEDVTVTGQGAAVAPGRDATGIYINADGFVLRNVDVSGFRNEGVFINSLDGAGQLTANGVIDPSTISNNLGDGIRILCANNMTIRDSTIANNTLNGIHIEGGNNILITDNSLDSSGSAQIRIEDADCSGAPVFGDADTESDTINIFRNTINVASDGIVVDDETTDVLVGGSLVDGNTFTGIPVGVCNGASAQDADCYIENQSDALPGDPDGSPDINAQFNRWDVTTLDEVEARVCHDDTPDENSACWDTDGAFVDFSNAILGGFIEGSVDLQGWDGSGCDVGPPNFCESVVDINPTQTLPTGEGAFSIAVNVGTHDVTVTHKGYLTERVCNVDVGAGATVDVGTITLLGGDVDGVSVGSINIQDLAFIAARFGGSDPEADINGDGTINIQDLSIAAGNFGQSADVCS